MAQIITAEAVWPPSYFSSLHTLFYKNRTFFPSPAIPKILSYIILK